MTAAIRTPTYTLNYSDTNYGPSPPPARGLCSSARCVSWGISGIWWQWVCPAVLVAASSASRPAGPHLYLSKLPVSSSTHYQYLITLVSEWIILFQLSVLFSANCLYYPYLTIPVLSVLAVLSVDLSRWRPVWCWVRVVLCRGRYHPRQRACHLLQRNLDQDHR